MSLIQVSNLTFGYDGSFDLLFENVSFQLDTKWKTGFIGRNGRGKTTFLKLLMGEFEYTGTISASVGFDYFPFPVEDPAAMVWEIADKISGGEMWRLNRELSLLGMEEDILYRAYSSLSGGEKVKVLLATMFLKENRFLLIDEPTNHLDIRGREIVGSYLRKKDGFLLVSHDRAFLDECIDHVLSIQRTGLEVQQGNFSSWERNRQYHDQFEREENEKLKKEISRLKEAAGRTASWSEKVERSKIGSGAADRGFVGHRAAKMMQRSKSAKARMEKAIEEKSGLLKDIEQNEPLKLSPITHYSRILVEARNLCLSYGDHTVCGNVNFSLESGKILSLQGRNGCGKSSILKAVLGELSPERGTISKASGLVISYVPQDFSFLQGTLEEFVEQYHLEESLFKTILRKLDFSRGQFSQRMEDFSAGQKKKVLLAKSLCERAHLYLWDEPLNYVDVLSRIQIENLIREYHPSMLLVEHDKTFLNSIGCEIVEVDGSF